MGQERVPRFAHLQAEIDKGKDLDDPAKMVRYWIKITDGTIEPHELVVLRRLAGRNPRRVMLTDSELYLTMFANQLVALYEQQELQLLRDELKKAADDKVHQDFQKQIDELKQQIHSLSRSNTNKAQ